jgi:para-aminobenzoate synthetase component 1
MPLLNLGLYDWAIISDHHAKQTFLFSANQHQSTQEIVSYVLALWNSSVDLIKDFKIFGKFKELMSKEHYKYGFDEIKKALQQGRSYQVNFTQPFQVPFEGDTWAMYHKICRENPVPFSAFLRMNEEDILSFSPERFLSFEEGRLLTSPIKGTIRRANNTLEDEQLKKELVSSAKNRAENVMIVDLLRNDLGKIAKVGSVNVLNLWEVQSYKHVHHLVSNIEAKSKEGLSSLDLFLSCFPGGSITGAPKLESMHIINELELYGRGVYCGSILYFSNHGRFDSNIAIRTIIAKNTMLHLAAGGGIVIDSNYEDEYRECFIKIKAIINGLK